MMLACGSNHGIHITIRTILVLLLLFFTSVPSVAQDEEEFFILPAVECKDGKLMIRLHSFRSGKKDLISKYGKEFVEKLRWDFGRKEIFKCQ